MAFQAVNTNYHQLVVDISSWQGNIDFDQFVSKNPQGVYLRAYGSDHSSGGDVRMAEYAQALAERNVPTGAYFFAWIDNVEDFADAERQAELFIQKLYQVYGEGQTGELMPMLDLEGNRNVTSRVPASGVYHEELDTELMLYWADHFRNHFEQITGRKLGLYTGYHFIKDHNNFNHGLSGTDGNILNDMPLWVAGYVYGGSYRLDEGMDAVGGWERWIGWQYTDRGDGVYGNGFEFGTESEGIDLNYFEPLDYLLPPVVPTLSYTKPSEQIIRLNWEIDRENDVNHAGYYLYRRWEGTHEWYHIETFSSDVHTFDAGPMVRGSTFEFMIVAVNGWGETRRSNVIVDAIPMAPVQDGYPPRPILSAEITGENEVTISWEPYPPASNRSGVQIYVDSRWIAWQGYSTTSRIFNDHGTGETRAYMVQFEDTDLNRTNSRNVYVQIPDPSVDYDVLAENDLGEIGVVWETPPTNIQAPPIPEVTIEEINETDIRIDWPAFVQEDAWQIELFINGELMETLPPSETGYTLTNLELGEVVTIQVIFLTRHYIRETSEVVSYEVSNPPPTPQNVAIERANEVYRLTWDEFVHENRSHVNIYVNGNVTQQLMADETVYTFDYFTTGQHEIMVEFVTTDELTSQSNVLVVEVLPPPKPTGLILERVDINAYQLSWDEFIHENRSMVRILLNEANFDELEPSRTSYRFESLPTGMTHYIVVEFVTIDEMVSRSDVIEVTVPSDLPDAPDESPPPIVDLPEPTERGIRTFNFNGISSKDYFLVNSIEQSMMPEIEQDDLTVPYRSGAYPTQRRLGVREFSITVTRLSETWNDLRNTMREVAKWLYTDKDKVLWFSDEPERYYNARLVGSSEIEETDRMGELQLTFVAYDPFAYTLQEVSEAFVGPYDEVEEGQDITRQVFINEGTYQTYPRIRFMAYGDVNYVRIRNHATNQIILIDGEAIEEFTNYVIDTNTNRVYREHDEVNLMEYVDLSSRFFPLKVGENVLSYETGNTTRLSIRLYWREKFL